jgi:hypothetical protein
MKRRLRRQLRRARCAERIQQASSNTSHSDTEDQLSELEDKPDDTHDGVRCAHFVTPSAACTPEIDHGMSGLLAALKIGLTFHERHASALFSEASFAAPPVTKASGTKTQGDSLATSKPRARQEMPSLDLSFLDD